MTTTIVRSRRVVLPSEIGSASIHIRDGRIEAVRGFDDVSGSGVLFEAEHKVVMPGIVDTHVHLNEPGRTDWEGFATGTRAAAAGGITTLIDMPLNSIPPAISREALLHKIAAAETQCWIDVGFWGGVVPGNTPELRPLFDEGAFGFKCFLVPSGVPEFGHVTESNLREALPEIARLGALLLVHAELIEPIEEAQQSATTAPPVAYESWLRSRPRAAEDLAVQLLMRLSREFGARIHVVHLSSSNSLEPLRRAKETAIPITAETCHHYLFFGAETIADGRTEFKCAPPIRENENREKLWDALEQGWIDAVVTDHSPSPGAMKCAGSGNFLEAWGGISSLQLSLPVLWTEARRRGHGIDRIANWLCRGPAKLAGLDRRKGAITPGFDADLVVWDPDATFKVEPSSIQHKHKLTPYADHELFGVVDTTFVRGEMVYSKGRFSVDPKGTILRRDR